MAKATPRDPIWAGNTNFNGGYTYNFGNNNSLVSTGSLGGVPVSTNPVLTAAEKQNLQHAIDLAAKAYYSLKKQHEILTYWQKFCTNTGWSPSGGGLYAGENYVTPIYSNSELNIFSTPVEGLFRTSEDYHFEDITAVTFLHPYHNTSVWGANHYELALPDIQQAITAITPLLEKARTDWNHAKYNLNKALSTGVVPKGAIPSGTGNTSGAGTEPITDAPPTKAQLKAKADFDKKPVITNVGMLKQNYLPVRSDSIGENNMPSYVTNALELWSNSSPNKGMIVTWYPPDAVTSTIVPDKSAQAQNISTVKYGFQFLYNPGTLEMTYSAIEGVDLGWLASGKDQTNVIPPQNGGGGIRFNLLLNRQADMAQYTTSGKLITPGKYALRDPYSGTINPVGFDEQKAIYNKGTMYDIEFLLRAATGYTMRSELRNELTSDIGYYARRQVELHLGPKLRYRGFISNIIINHYLFDERMVPTLTNLSIGFARLPDFANTNTINPYLITVGGN